MKIKTIILVTLLVISCNDVFAQEVETDYEALYKKELARQDSLNGVLQDLRNRQKSLLSITDNIGDLVPPVALFWYR